jgi:biopolymer transport protein TolR
MAGGLHHRNGAGRRSYKPMAEINVTPMVDVMLVLLIVFMVAAPLMTAGVPVDLPKSQAPAINENKEPIEITITADGQIHIQKTPIEANELVAKLQAITNNNSDAVVYVRGDTTINYGRVMEVMGLLAAASFTKLNLITVPAPSDGKP